MTKIDTVNASVNHPVAKIASSIVTSLSLAATLMFSLNSFSHDEHGDAEAHSGGHFSPKPAAALTNPAKAYSGGTPIDMSHGLGFNNGTFGQTNDEYAKWGQSSTWAVSLAERPYSFEQKDRFIQTLDERIMHYEHAVWNWARVSATTKPEVKVYAETATTEIKPRIERARQMWKAAKSSGQGDWEKNQDEAKRAFLELQSYYTSLHKNVR